MAKKSKAALKPAAPVVAAPVPMASPASILDTIVAEATPAVTAAPVAPEKPVKTVDPKRAEACKRAWITIRANRAAKAAGLPVPEPKAAKVPLSPKIAAWLGIADEPEPAAPDVAAMEAALQQPIVAVEPIPAAPVPTVKPRRERHPARVAPKSAGGRKSKRSAT